MHVEIKFKAGHKETIEAEHAWDIILTVAKKYSSFGNMPGGFYIIDSPVGNPVNPNQELPLRGKMWDVFFEGKVSDLLVAEAYYKE